MISVTTTSVHRLARGDVDEQPVMTWSCPVPYFGRLHASKVATLGINPSNREFLDSAGRELDGVFRRFPTLTSLGLPNWGEASSRDLAEIVMACDEYFAGNPYNRWFGVLDAVIQGTGASYYSDQAPAAHLDLVPYATHTKWGELRSEQQRALLTAGADLLGALLRDSSIELLILNGRSVVREFERISGQELERQRHSAWDLQRNGSSDVHGHGYVGQVERLGSVDLGRTIIVMGFNHNLQSSFGVTRRALTAIAKWLSAGRSS